MNVFYLELEAKPLKDNLESEEFGGAYISCWVNSKDETNALEEAVIYIRDEGWEVTNVNDKYITCRKDFEHYPESLECFDRAVKEGICAIFHVWSIDDENGEGED